MDRGQTRHSVRVGQVPLLYYWWGHGHRRIGAWEKAGEHGSLHPEPSLKPGPGATPSAGSTCKSSSTEFSKVIGKLERADWIFPRSPKKMTPEEREGEGEAGAEAARLAELPAVPCPARSPQGWCSAWEMLSLPPAVPNSHFPVGLKSPGFTGGESCCSGVIWCMKYLGDILKTFCGVKQQLRLCLAPELGRDRHGSGGHAPGLPRCSSLGLLIINPNYNPNYKPRSTDSRVHARCSHHGEQWEQSRGHVPNTLLGVGGPELPLPRAERLLPHVPCSAEGRNTSHRKATCCYKNYIEKFTTYG